METRNNDRITEGPSNDQMKYLLYDETQPSPPRCGPA